MSETTTIAPVQKTVRVPCDPATAFRVFTAEIGSWWPVETHALGDDVREVVWEERLGGEIVEVSGAGDRALWGRVIAWEPPSRLALEWHVNLPAGREPTEIEVRFAPHGTGTVVELEHRHWERLGPELAGRRDGYETGWDAVLGRFVQALAVA